MIPLVILRPERGAVATARRATALGLSPMIRSLFVVERRDWDAPDPSAFDSMLLTSANAVRYGGDAVGRYRALPAYAVGHATAHSAREAGFASVFATTGNADRALRALCDAGHRRPLHLAGKQWTAYPDLPFAVTTHVVYEALPCDVALPIGRYVALVHSARAATRFAAHCPSPALVDLVAISAPVAEAAGAGWHSVSTAAEPTDDAMLALAAALCDGGAMPTGPT